MSWKDNYRFGTLLLLPPKNVSSIVDMLRAQYDPESHKTCVSHITLTQPLLEKPTSGQIASMRDLAMSIAPFTIQYGPVQLFGSKCVVFGVEPKQEIVSIRNRFHETGLFNVSLPYTDGFVPHMTISETGIPDAHSIIPALNREHSGGAFQCARVFYLIPNDAFVFEVADVFELSTANNAMHSDVDSASLHPRQ